MKFLIWIAVIIPVALLKTIIENGTGQSIPPLLALLLTIPVFYFAPILCKKYDEYKKNQDDEDKTK
jgi:hypothetical protein